MTDSVTDDMALPVHPAKKMMPPLRAAKGVLQPLAELPLRAAKGVLQPLAELPLCHLAEVQARQLAASLT